MFSIKEFCVATSDVRHYLREPFIAGTHIVATNGESLIAIPCDSTDLAILDIVPETLISRVSNMLKDALEVDYVAMLEITLPNYVECSICNGTKKSKRADCNECDGEGEVDLENDFHEYTAECKTCDGYGSTEVVGGEEDCFNCNGVGAVDARESSVLVEGIYIQPKYVRLINKLPNVEVSSNEATKMLYFKSGDYTGFILGMSI